MNSPYRKPPDTCIACGELVNPARADMVESGLRCQKCTDAAELAALQPKLAEAKAYFAHGPGCDRHPLGDSSCLWCWLRGCD
jgi:hypothetical protein